MDIHGSLPVHTAAVTGQDIILKRLLSDQTEVGGAGHSHHTSLASETMTGQGRTLHSLINHVDYVNSMDKNGNTPFMLSAKRGHVACVYLPLRHGSNICLKNSRGRTALDFAQKYDKTGTS